MNQHRKQMMGKKQQGFTLIEIMIVITLLGLIGTWAVTNYVGKLEESKRRGSKIVMQQLRTILDDFMRTCGSYPTTAQGGLDALITAPADGSCKDYTAGGYLKDNKLPKDGWGRPFVYLSEDGRKYTLKSLGPSGKEGGQGNDKEISTDDTDF